MANRKASIWLYKKIDGRWRYVKPAIDRNGKIKPDPGAAFYLRYREGGKMVWRKCSSAADATVACERQEAYPPQWSMVSLEDLGQCFMGQSIEFGQAIGGE